ncbi:MAG: uroporphyrinogen-III synthase [Rhodoferax sp.]|nr:uroporphyrinogen-III synthase [Rhodoferax sp.]
MRVIVTRPAREAHRWVLDLAAQGLEAVALPLISVGPVDDPAPLVQAWQHLDDYVGVMFVSGNAVEQFFASKPPLSLVVKSQNAIKTRAWATGPGTARALSRAGVTPDCMDVPPLDVGQFDSEALWQVVQTQVRTGDRVLIVRGGDAVGNSGQGSGREWFANRLSQAGAQADFVVAYQRSAPAFTELERQMAVDAATDGSVWLFSSTEALGHLIAWLPDQSWGKARALATHPRIAAAARAAGFGVVVESRPTLNELVNALRLSGSPSV